MALIWLPFLIVGALCIYSGFVVSPTAMTEGGFPVKVHIPGQPDFILEHTEYVPLIKLGSFSVGQEVQVYADQRDHKKLIIGEEEIRSL